jgi:hypothetical protein
MFKQSSPVGCVQHLDDQLHAAVRTSDVAGAARRPATAQSRS